MFSSKKAWHASFSIFVYLFLQFRPVLSLLLNLPPLVLDKLRDVVREFVVLLLVALVLLLDVSLHFLDFLGVLDNQAGLR